MRVLLEDAECGNLSLFPGSCGFRRMRALGAGFLCVWSVFVRVRLRPSTVALAEVDFDRSSARVDSRTMGRPSMLPWSWVAESG